jgi:hypothetical protein
MLKRSDDQEFHPAELRSANKIHTRAHSDNDIIAQPMKRKFDHRECGSCAHMENCVRDFISLELKEQPTLRQRAALVGLMCCQRFYAQKRKGLYQRFAKQMNERNV